jgi:nitronate monooxygenase
MTNWKHGREITAPANADANASWRLTRAAQLLGIEYPIIQAPFGGLPSQHLTATVSNLGGLGSLGAVTLGGSAIREVIGEIHSLTERPFAINLWVSTSDQRASQISVEAIDQALQSYASYYAELGIERPSHVETKSQDFEAQVASAIEARAPVLSFTFGIPPAEVLTECRKQGIKTIGTATTPEEAVALEDAGLDLIVASGFEGGGHRGSFLRSAADSLMGSISLIPQVVDAVRVPVIAAGGIADARGIAAAFALGAAGVQIGTAFLPCAGSGASKPHVAALLSEAPKPTALTDAYTGRLARGLRNRLMNELEARSSSPLPYPVQHAVTQTFARPAAEQGKTELTTLWAGQSASLSRCADATELMTRLIAGTDAYFSKHVAAGRSSESASRGATRPSRIDASGISIVFY